MRIHLKTLDWALHALEEGRITKDEFNILVYCARKVQWDTMRVPAYSAAQVCRFYGEDANQANLRRYNRALKSLESVTSHSVRDDYRHCRVGNERTYSVFLPFESPWAAEKSRVSLYEGMSHTDVAHDVATAVPTNGSANIKATKTCDDSSAEMSQPLSQGVSHTSRHPMSIPTQENQNPEKEPLNPLRGLPPLPSPSGRNAQTPPGSESQNLRARKSLSSEQAAKLDDAARLFADFCNWLYGFVPDIEAVTTLLRHFTAKEVLFATVNKFAPRSEFRKTDMAHYFARGAKTLIEAARIKNCSETEPDSIQYVSLRSDGDGKEFHPRLKAVLDAYEQAFPDPAGPDGQCAVEAGMAVMP
jgi:hypothetical protein